MPPPRPGLVLAFSLLAMPVFSQQAESEPARELPAVEWSAGPSRGDLGSKAEVDVPQGYRFTAGAGTKALLEAFGNPTSGDELGFLAPDDLAWFVVFEFDATGYIKDDEKDKLDADAMLEAIKKGNEAGNEERKKRGWSTMEIVGWEEKPHYDPATNNLEWAIRGQSEGHAIVNYNTRILGRKGVMEAALVVSPEALQATLPEFRQLLAGYSYKSGEKYAEFKQGDKVAAIGLAALVTGGAAAVALKTGLLQKFWKFLLVGVVALAAAIKRLFARFSVRQDHPAPPAPRS